MNSRPCVIFFLALFATCSYGAVSIGFFNDSANPGRCTISENLILSPGEIKDPNSDCGRIICYSNGMAEFQTCGVQMVSGCRMGDYVDKSLPYPECCKRHVICD